MNTICFYHADCFDGVAAAWAVWKAHPDATFYPMHYKAPLPESVLEKDVIIVDYTFEEDVFKTILTEAANVILLDHHPRAEGQVETINKWWPQHTGRFDKNKSGAILAWEFFHPDEEPPMLLRYVSDYDLWQFKMTGTRKVMSAMNQYRRRLEDWKSLPITNGSFSSDIAKDADVLERQFTAFMQDMVEQSQRQITLGGYTVPLISIPKAFASRSLEYLAKQNPAAEFVAGYYDSATHREYSLRPTSSRSVAVNEIARLYGGDGHPTAAGFRVPRDHALALV